MRTTVDWLDLYLSQQRDDAMLAAALVAAFGVPPHQVRVTRANTDESMDAWQKPQVRVLVIRERTVRGGDFPFGFTVMLKEPVDRVADVVSRVQLISRHLGVPFMTNAATPDFPDDVWRLVTPDGWSEVVAVDEDELSEGRMTLTPAAHRLLAAHTTMTQEANARHAS